MSVAGDFILKILETDLTSLYFLPWIITGSILVIAKVGLALFGEWVEEKSSRPVKHARSAKNGEWRFQGKRQGTDFENGDFELDFLMYGFIFTAGLAFVGTIITFAGFVRHEDKLIWVALALAVVGWASLTVIYRITFGVRASLAISNDGVTFRGRTGYHARRECVSIRWSDVVDFAVVEGEETHGPWLVAIPPPRSPLILHGPASKMIYDRDNNRLLICSLDDIGIQKHLVLGALDNKRPVN